MNRRGTTLLEIVASMALLAVVLAAASRLMLSNLRTLRTTDERIAQSAGLDMMLARLKYDAWSAQRIETAPDTATLHRADGTIVWRVLDDGRVARRAGDEPEQRWPTPGTDGRLQFAESPSGLLVNLGEPPAMLVVSQVLRGGQP